MLRADEIPKVLAVFLPPSIRKGKV